MGNAIANKLKIKEQDVLLTFHAPDNFAAELEPLPDGVKIIKRKAKCSQVHWFVSNRMQLEAELDEVLALVTGEVICWIYYPKGTSKIQTDLTRDKGWESLLSHDELKWISLISFDATWSVFGCRMKTDADKSKEAKPKEREIFEYINAATKEIRLPEDLALALKQNKKEAAIFDSLSFSNRKEYLEWILTAKREETRNQRISATLEKLANGWKNPNNR